MANIRQEPGTFAYACLVRLGRFWSPLPHQIAADETPLRRLSRWAVAVWYFVEFLLRSSVLGIPRPSRAGHFSAQWERSEVEVGNIEVRSQKSIFTFLKSPLLLPLSPFFLALGLAAGRRP